MSNKLDDTCKSKKLKCFEAGWQTPHESNKGLVTSSSLAERLQFQKFAFLPYFIVEAQAIQQETEPQPKLSGTVEWKTPTSSQHLTARYMGTHKHAESQKNLQASTLPKSEFALTVNIECLCKDFQHGVREGHPFSHGIDSHRRVHILSRTGLCLVHVANTKIAVYFWKSCPWLNLLSPSWKVWTLQQALESVGLLSPCRQQCTKLMAQCLQASAPTLPNILCMCHTV